MGAAATFRGGMAGGGPRPAVEPCDWARGGTCGNLELGAGTLGAFCGGALTDVIDGRGDVVLGGDEGVGFVCGWTVAIVTLGFGGETKTLWDDVLGGVAALCGFAVTADAGG